MTRSGKFVLRLDPPLHSRLVREAQKRGTSLNQICRDLIQNGLAGGTENRAPDPGSHYAEAVSELRRRFGTGLVGVALFGSQVTGEADPRSDHDLLVLLRPEVSLGRSHYQWWDESVRPPSGENWNPHFVRRPKRPEEAGGLLLEVASSSLLLWETGSELTYFLSQLKRMIAERGYRRYWSNGHPFWVKTDAEQNAGS